MYRLFKKPNDRSKEYWQKAAKADIETTMEKICHGFNEDTFKTKKDSVLFYLDIPLKKDATILDLACGIGRTCQWVAPNVKQYVGIDFIPEMITKAREYNKQYSNTVFYSNDGKTIPLEDKSVDIVYCEIAFQHMVKKIQESYVSEIYRVLKDGGSFYAQIPRLEFYKDESYAHNDEQITELLHNFSVKYYNDISHEGYKMYYVFKATKKLGEF